MPKRTTLTFTSEDIPGKDVQESLFSYYCKFTGQHAFTIGQQHVGELEDGGCWGGLSSSCCNVCTDDAEAAVQCATAVLAC
jgi:hypothetical protein